MRQLRISSSPPFARRGIPPVILDFSAPGAGASSAANVLIVDNPPAAANGLAAELTERPANQATALAGTAIKVLIADDHPFVRSGIKQCINDSAGMAVVGEAGTAREVFEFLKNSTCDVLVLDIGLPDQSGLEVLRILKKTRPELPILILTMYPEDQFSQFCLRAGAAGFLSKSNASNHLVDAIRKVTRSDRAVSPAPEAKLAPEAEAVPQVLPHLALSEAEFQTFCLIASGKTRKMIAAAQGVSLMEVNARRARIFKVMHMNGNDEIVRYALTHHLCS